MHDDFYFFPNSGLKHCRWQLCAGVEKSLWANAKKNKQTNANANKSSNVDIKKVFPFLDTAAPVLFMLTWEVRFAPCRERNRCARFLYSPGWAAFTIALITRLSLPFVRVWLQSASRTPVKTCCATFFFFFSKSFFFLDCVVHNIKRLPKL